MKRLLSLIAVVTVFLSAVAFTERAGFDACVDQQTPNVCVDLAVGFIAPIPTDINLLEYQDNIGNWQPVIRLLGESCSDAILRLQGEGFTQFRCETDFIFDL